jgi:predicted transcriptional regulator
MYFAGDRSGRGNHHLINMGRPADISKLNVHYQFIEQNPGLSYRELAVLLGKSHSGVESMLSTMELFGYLVSEYEGRIYTFNDAICWEN